MEGCLAPAMRAIFYPALEIDTREPSGDSKAMAARVIVVADNYSFFTSLESGTETPSNQPKGLRLKLAYQ